MVWLSIVIWPPFSHRSMYRETVRSSDINDVIYTITTHGNNFKFFFSRSVSWLSLNLHQVTWPDTLANSLTSHHGTLRVGNDVRIVSDHTRIFPLVHMPVYHRNIYRILHRKRMVWTHRNMVLRDPIENIDVFTCREYRPSRHNDFVVWATQPAVFKKVFYTGAATVLPPLCDHKTDQVAVEGRKEAERLPWSFNGGAQDVQTSPWTPWSPWSFEHVQNSRRKVAGEVGRAQVAQRRQEEGTHIAVVADWMHSGRPLVASWKIRTVVNIVYQFEQRFCLPCTTIVPPLADQ